MNALLLSDIAFPKFKKTITSQDLKIFIALSSATTMDDVIEDADSCIRVLKFLPLIYNRINNWIQVSDFLSRLTIPNTDFEMSKFFFRWLPLLAPYIDVEETIERVINNDRTGLSGSQSAAYFYLCMYSAIWSRMVSPQFANNVLETALTKDKDSPLFNFLPWKDIPDMVKQNRQAKYIQMSFDEMEVTDQIIPVKSQNQYAGTCPQCRRMHWNVIMEEMDENYAKAGIIRVNGRPIFVLKLKGDPSMVALQTLKTPDGRLACVKGGVYVPSKEMIALFDRENPSIFPVIDVKQPISVMPLGWIGSMDGGTGNNWSQNKLSQYINRLSAISEVVKK